jgi:hypothetical protein
MQWAGTTRALRRLCARLYGTFTLLEARRAWTGCCRSFTFGERAKFFRAGNLGGAAVNTAHN